jgi:hypothetical protein
VITEGWVSSDGLAERTVVLFVHDTSSSVQSGRPVVCVALVPGGLFLLVFLRHPRPPLCTQEAVYRLERVPGHALGDPRTGNPRGAVEGPRV